MPTTISTTIPKVEVHTIRFGREWWMDFFPPTLDAWCQRHGHRLRVWKAEDIDPSYPSAKFAEVDMLREFLAGDADWLLYVDADVYVDPNAPRDPGFAGMFGFMIRRDIGTPRPKIWNRWLEQRFGRQAVKKVRGWKYRNAGVWACDRKSAEDLLGVITLPYHKGTQEQHHWNWWLALAVENGMQLFDLPQQWNQWWHEDGTAAFYHVCGKRKHAKVKSMKERGVIPMEQGTGWSWKESYDATKYRFTRDGTLMGTDEAHIQMLHACLGIDSHRPLGSKVVVEVGSYRGASTSALLDGIDRGIVERLHVIEVSPTDSLRRAIAACAHPERVTLHTNPFWEIDIESPDLVFIDGNHKWPAVGDVLHALASDAFLIAMHDTNSFPRFPDCWGSVMAAKALLRMKGRKAVIDNQTRPGLNTDRGFMVSAPEGVDLSTVQAIADSITLK